MIGFKKNWAFFKSKDKWKEEDPEIQALSGTDHTMFYNLKRKIRKEKKMPLDNEDGLKWS